MYKIIIFGVLAWLLVFSGITLKAMWNARKEQEHEEEKARHS